MKRKVIKLCVFLFAGAIMNVVVAWGCAYFQPAPNNAGNPVSAGFVIAHSCEPLSQPFYESGWDITHKYVRRIKKPGAELIVVATVGSPAAPTHAFEELLPPTLSVGEIRQHEIDSQDSAYNFGFYLWDGRGWPCIAMSSTWPWFQSRTWPSIPVSDGLTFGPKPTTSQPWPYNIYELRAFPLRPIWPGFAINTVFYAAILWLLFAAPGKIRRFIRGRRGQCPACAYPIGTSDVCTECGAPVPAKS